MNAEIDAKALEDTCASVVEAAVKGGATTAVVRMAEKATFALEVRGGVVENLSEARGRQLSLSISVDQRRASVTTCDLSPDSLKQSVDNALALARYTDVDEYYSLPDPTWLIGDEPDELDLYDQSLETLPLDDRIDRVRRAEALLLEKNPDLKCDGSSMGMNLQTSVIANSIGFLRSRKQTSCLQGITGFAEDKGDADDLNTGRKQQGSWVSRARHLEDLDDPETIVDHAARVVRRKLGPRKPQSGNYPIYFEPVMARVLWGHFLDAISGTSVYRKASYLADRIDTPVTADFLQLHDDPRRVRGLGSCLYDNEGVASVKTPLIQDGVLQTYTLGTYSGRKLGRRSTGHANGVNNLVVQPGTLSEEAMLKEMGTGVWLTSVLGQGVNVSNGEYSRGALGIWVENGVPQYPIHEFTINSNLDEMYRNIILLGRDVYANSSILSPGFVIADMAVSGN